MTAPLELGDSRVVAYVVLDDRSPSGVTTYNTPDGSAQTPYALALCKAKNEGGWFLFHCDKQWNILADTWHASEAEARSQAEFEYAGGAAHWCTSR